MSLCILYVSRLRHRLLLRGIIHELLELLHYSCKELGEALDGDHCSVLGQRPGPLRLLAAVSILLRAPTSQQKLYTYAYSLFDEVTHALLVQRRLSLQGS